MYVLLSGSQVQCSSNPKNWAWQTRGSALSTSRSCGMVLRPYTDLNPEGNMRRRPKRHTKVLSAQRKEVYHLPQLDACNSAQGQPTLIPASGSQVAMPWL